MNAEVIREILPASGLLLLLVTPKKKQKATQEKDMKKILAMIKGKKTYAAAFCMLLVAAWQFWNGNTDTAWQTFLAACVAIGLRDALNGQQPPPSNTPVAVDPEEAEATEKKDARLS
jgi:hypothetical protein